MTGAHHEMARRRVVRALSGEAGFSLAEMLVVIVILGMMMSAVFLTLDISQKSYSRATAAEDALASMRAGMDRMASDLRLIGSFYSGSGSAASPITAFVENSSITFWGDVDADTASTSVSGGTTTVTDATLTAAVSAAATDLTVTAAVSGTYGATGFTAGEMLYIADGSVREVATVSSAPSSGNSIVLSSGVVNAYAAGSLVRSVEQVTYTYTAGTGGALGTLTRTTAAGGTETLLDNVVSFTLTGYDYAGSTTTNIAGIEEIAITVTTRGSAVATGANTRTMTTRVRLRVVPTS